MKTEPNENWRETRERVGSKIMPYKDLSLAGSDRSTTSLVTDLGMRKRSRKNEVRGPRTPPRTPELPASSERC
ncbi:hypothetical protein K0M31_004408 [Melipona bicolor]|uniref:Uncharacterized protein n=1 Tax=Melipona bicolor TaxID=60889 RepID=A0AA40KNF7_9HYME|nr:hypothetical protein K0M31_004408 [Melipona bicolor]